MRQSGAPEVLYTQPSAHYPYACQQRLTLKRVFDLDFSFYTASIFFIELLRQLVFFSSVKLSDIEGQLLNHYKL